MQIDIFNYEDDCEFILLVFAAVRVWHYLASGQFIAKAKLELIYAYLKAQTLFFGVSYAMNIVFFENLVYVWSEINCVSVVRVAQAGSP